MSSPKNNYPGAESKAQREVKAAMRRFRALSDKERDKQPFWAWLLGKDLQEFKHSQSDSAFQNFPNGKEKCGNCAYYYKQMVGPDLTCSQVRGTDIQDEDWCRRWEKSEKD